MQFLSGMMPLSGGVVVADRGIGVTVILTGLMVQDSKARPNGISKARRLNRISKARQPSRARTKQLRLRLRIWTSMRSGLRNWTLLQLRKNNGSVRPSMPCLPKRPRQSLFSQVHVGTNVVLHRFLQGVADVQ